MRLCHKTKRAYRVLMLDDEVDNKFMKLQETYPEKELNPTSPPMPVDDIKNHMNNTLSVRRLIEDI